MKSSGKYYLFLFSLLLIYSCNQKQKNERLKLNKQKSLFSWFEKDSSFYKYNNIVIGLESRSRQSLLKKESFQTDSIYKIYEQALLKNNYFTLNLKPDESTVSRLPRIDKALLRQKTHMIVCGDTIFLAEVALLQDFGLSKQQQLMLVFPKKANNKGCEVQVVVGGLFNRFDSYEFSIASDELN